jgi:hypothetical protein
MVLGFRTGFLAMILALGAIAGVLSVAYLIGQWWNRW